MVARYFKSPSQERLFKAVAKNLRTIGYSDDLLSEEYAFSDYFKSDRPTRTAPLAVFGQTPHSSDTACFAVLLANGRSGVGLVQDFRALGAPGVFEVSETSVSCWRVGHDEDATRQLLSFDIQGIDQAFKTHEDQWRPEAVLRSKNVASRPQLRQKQLFDFDYDLVPALESEVRKNVEPMVKDACAAAVEAYFASTGRAPDESQLFKLAFWLLAGKVFHDRRVPGFAGLTKNATADEVLEKVAKHYSQALPSLLNARTRQAVHSFLWTMFDFRNLSIDILTHIWTHTFVTPEMRERHGIHPTPRSIAKYIVDNVPFEDFEPENRIVIEPCCGSATFLLAALQRLRDQPGQTHDPKVRHKYFQKCLIGFERDAFGVEISRLCLTLADFPNPNGWQLYQQDVFRSEDFQTQLASARIVLCNPPFEDFSSAERTTKGMSVKKPSALLSILLSHLHHDGILGFVLPRLIVDGQGYRRIRQELAARYEAIDVVALPDNAFDTADHETALLIAHKPRRDKKKATVAIRYSTVAEHDWELFRTHYETTTSTSATKTITEATTRFIVQALPRVWSSTRFMDSLGKIAEIHRGIEWTLPLTEDRVETGNRQLLVRTTPAPNHKLGLPPLAGKASDFSAFQPPQAAYLRMLPEDERGNSYSRPWDLPKVILNKATKARGRWRIAAFADFRGLVFYQTFTGIWPHDPDLTTVIAAVLNSPVANAFVSTIEGKVDITSDTLREIPIPHFKKRNREQLEQLVAEYTKLTSAMANKPVYVRADMILRRIDALVLNAYDFSPKVERELLDYFNGHERIVPFGFADYFPADFKPCFSLADWLTGKPARATAKRFREQSRDIPEHILQALRHCE